MASTDQIPLSQTLPTIQPSLLSAHVSEPQDVNTCLATKANGRAGSQRPSSSRYPSWRDDFDENSLPSDDKLENGGQHQNAEDREQRSVSLKWLSDRVTHGDIVKVVRGGALLDVYLRKDRTASVSFVEPSAAQAFLAHAKRHDIYLCGKRVSSSQLIMLDSSLHVSD